MLVDKSADDDEGPATRRRKTGSEDRIATPCRGKRSEDTEEQSALMPTKRGGGKGLKAVQTSHEEEKTRTKVNGESETSRSKVKEQKLYHARSNEHVETKIVT